MQVQSLAKQIATLETRELNEKQRGDHAEGKCKLLQAQIGQLEKRNEELETKFAEISQSNLNLQKTERELRDQVCHCFFNQTRFVRALRALPRDPEGFYNKILRN